MKKIVSLFIITGVLLAGQPVIFHLHRDQIPIQKQVLECTVDDNGKQIKQVRIFLRTCPAGPYQEYEMISRDGVYQFPLIPEMLDGDSLYYFITVGFNDLSCVALPAQTPENNPLVSAINPKPENIIE